MNRYDHFRKCLVKTARIYASTVEDVILKHSKDPQPPEPDDPLLPQSVLKVVKAYTDTILVEAYSYPNEKIDAINIPSDANELELMDVTWKVLVELIDTPPYVPNPNTGGIWSDASIIHRFLDWAGPIKYALNISFPEL